MSTWCSNAVNRASLSLGATSRTRSSALGASFPALCPGRVLLSVFPLVMPLSSTASAAGTTPALFGRFAGTTGMSDFPGSFIPGLPPQRCLDVPPGHPPVGRSRDLPVLAHEGSTHALVLRPRRVHQTARDNAASGVAFRLVNGVGTPKLRISRLNSPAYVYPCQRFAAPSRV